MTPNAPIPTSLIRDILTGLCACTVIFALSLYLPLLGFLTAVLLPMPVLFYRLKLGRVPGAGLGIAVLILIVSVSGGPTLDVLFYGSLLAAGMAMGECIERNLPATRIGTVTICGLLGLIVLILAGYTLGTGNEWLPMVSAYVDANLKLTLSLYQQMGVPEENMAVITSAMDTITYVLVRILPSLVTALLMVIIWANILFIKTILARKEIRPSGLARLNRWKAPELLVWVVIACGAALMVPSRWIKVLALNGIIGLMPIYFFQGIAVVSFYFEKKQFPRAMRVFIYSIIALQQIFLLVVVGMGFFDTWINFRKINTADATSS